MAEFVQSFTLKDGVTKKKYDYNALGNLPTLQPVLTDTDGAYGQRIKALEDQLADVVDVEEITY